MRAPFVRRFTFLALVASLVLTGAACALSAEAEPPAASTTTRPAAPSAAATVAAAPTSPARTGPTTGAAVGAERLALVAGESQARYRAREQLAGRSLAGDAVGSTSDVTGSVVLGTDGRIMAEQSKVSVDLRSLRSDQDRRDSYIKRSTLQVDRFPAAEFVPRQAEGLPASLPTSGQVTFKLTGDLTIHGVTRPATWDVAAQLSGDRVTGTATTTVRLEDFGMTRPIVGPVLGIEETLTLELDFVAQREPQGA